MPDWRSLGVDEVRRDSEADMFYMAFDENTALNLEQAVCLQIAHYENSVREHINCDLKTEVGCKVAASSARPHQTDCTEDLMFLYGELGKMHRLLYNMREARMGNQKDWATQQFDALRDKGWRDDATGLMSGPLPDVPARGRAHVPGEDIPSGVTLSAIDARLNDKETSNGEPPAEHSEHDGSGDADLGGKNKGDRSRNGSEA